MSSAVKNLRKIISSYKSALIAYSGGVDSSLLLKVAFDEMGERAVAATIDSPIHAREDVCSARSTASFIGVRHIIIPGKELNMASFTNNPPERCYLCKKNTFTSLWEVARREKIAVVMDGSCADDLKDYRPGLKAAREMNIVSPLLSAGVNKKEIRLLAQELGLPNWGKPSQSCLCTRIPYGEPITLDKLERIEAAEKYLSDLGFSPVRVRCRGMQASIEVPQQKISLLAERTNRENIVDALKSMGFTHICIDLNGIRSGSLNEGVS